MLTGRGIPVAIGLALIATMATGLATAATKHDSSAKACVNSRGELRLLTGTRCPKGDHLIAVGQRGPRGARGKGAAQEHDDIAEATTQTALATKKNTVTRIVALRSLAAGSWVFTSQATVVNFGRADYFRCKIVAGKEQIASGATTVGTPGAAGVPGVPPGASTVAGMSLIGAVTSPRTFTVSMECWHDLKAKPASGTHQPPYVDPGAVLLARRVGSISATTS